MIRNTVACASGGAVGGTVGRVLNGDNVSAGTVTQDAAIGGAVGYGASRLAKSTHEAGEAVGSVLEAMSSEDDVP